MLTRGSYLFSLLFVLWMVGSCSRPKTGYVDVFELVNAFDLQREYTEAARANYHDQRSMIDSLVYAHRLRDSLTYRQAERDLYSALELQTQERTREIETIIWNRLNPYIVEFGRARGYDFIYGANGTGSLLYADEGKDLTSELIDYVNQRYRGKKID